MPEIADWTKPSSFSAGRDPLGFQAASVRLYTSLLPGLTNVTNRLRYYSFYCWVLWQFEQIHHTSKEDKWIPFIRRSEAAIALACLIGDPAKAAGMAGSDWWRNASADSSIKKFDLIKPTNRPGKDGQYLKAKFGNFGQFYTASMLEMKLIERVEDNSPRVFGVTEAAGKALALAVQEEHPKACELFLRAVQTGSISRQDCETISESLHPSYLDPKSEEARLLKEFIQGGREEDPTSEPRRITLRNILTVVADAEGEFDLRKELYVQPGGLREAPHAIDNLTEWRAYFINEFCHIALEVWVNGIVGLLDQLEEPSSVEKLANGLASIAVPDTKVSTSAFAKKLVLKDLETEHDLGSKLVAVTSTRKRPDAETIAGSAKLLLSLWLRWTSETEVRYKLALATSEGRSAEGVFRFLDMNQNANAREAIAGLIKKFVISNHLMIAGQKLATGGRFTYRFLLDDGCLVDGEYGEYTYTTPRIFNLLTFARDAHLVDPGSGKITAAGKEFLNDT